jgi:DNA-binding NarL/FixJ family response regulator
VDVRAETGLFSVMCIDDNELLIDALERRLGLEPDFGGLIRVPQLAQAADLARRLRPAVILLDVDLPGNINAMSLLSTLVLQATESRVIVFTGYPSGSLVARTMSAGAWGFISKGISAERLISAIRRVVAGEAVIELDE